MASHQDGREDVILELRCLLWALLVVSDRACVYSGGAYVHLIVYLSMPVYLCVAEAPFETQRQRGWHIIQYIHYLANVAVLYCIVYSVRFSFSPLMFDQLCTGI